MGGSIAWKQKRYLPACLPACPFHLFPYLDEQAFRFNERKTDDQGRFIKGIVVIIGKSLRYAKLIGEENEQQCLPA